MPAQAAPEKTDQELAEIGMSFDQAALEGLSSNELDRYIELSQLDTSKSSTVVSQTFTVDGAPATSAQTAELVAAIDAAAVSDLQAPTVASKLSPELAAAATCYYATNTNYGRNPTGNVVYTYYIQIKWCMSGSKVTSTSTIAKGGSTQWLGWDYLGISASGSGVINGWGRNYAQYKFQYSVFKVGVIQTVFPCMQLHGTSANVARVGSQCGLL